MTNVQRERKRVKKGGLRREEEEETGRKEEKGGEEEKEERGEDGRRGWRISHPTRERAKKENGGKTRVPLLPYMGHSCVI